MSKSTTEKFLLDKTQKLYAIEENQNEQEDNIANMKNELEEIGYNLDYECKFQ